MSLRTVIREHRMSHAHRLASSLPSKLMNLVFRACPDCLELPGGGTKDPYSLWNFHTLPSDASNRLIFGIFKKCPEIERQKYSSISPEL